MEWPPAWTTEASVVGKRLEPEGSSSNALTHAECLPVLPGSRRITAVAPAAPLKALCVPFLMSSIGLARGVFTQPLTNHYPIGAWHFAA
ncbi:MAG: hypothetical protein WA864_21915 [Acetobacteraceae bacterium]|jgi:hypothetical protein